MEKTELNKEVCGQTPISKWTGFYIEACKAYIFQGDKSLKLLGEIIFVKHSVCFEHLCVWCGSEGPCTKKPYIHTLFLSQWLHQIWTTKKQLHKSI